MIYLHSAFIIVMAALSTLLSSSASAGILLTKKSMTYDVFNRQLSWSMSKPDGQGGWTVEKFESSTYRGDKWHRTSSTSNGVTTNFLYDGDNVIADIVNGQVVKSYVTPTLDGNVSMTDIGNSTTYYYSQDERQSVKNLTDSSAVVANAYDYTAYGDKIDTLTSGSVPQRYTYTGREASELSDLYYFRYRLYVPRTGSFVSRDPLGYADGMGLYSGYFSTRLDEDPMGRMTARETAQLSKCEKFKAQFDQELAENRKLKSDERSEYWNNVIDIWDTIGNSKRGDGSPCGPPVFNCDCCKGNGEYIHGNQYSWGEWIFPSQIKICYNNIDDNTKFDSLKYTFYHELIHWKDSCGRPTSGKRQSCEQSMCAEMRAYRFSGQCSKANRDPGESEMDCVVRGIANSSWDYCKDKYASNGGQKAFEQDLINYYKGYMNAIANNKADYKGCPTGLNTPPKWAGR